MLVSFGPKTEKHDITKTSFSYNFLDDFLIFLEDVKLMLNKVLKAFRRYLPLLLSIEKVLEGAESALPQQDVC